MRLRCASWDQLESIYRRDLARGALFLRASRRPPIATPITIHLTLPSGTLIVLSGSISEHIAPGGLGGRGPGIDVELAPIPASTMWLVEAALRAHKQRSRAAPPDDPERAPDEISALGAEHEQGEATLEAGAPVAAAEHELVAALQDELGSLRHMSPTQVLGVAEDAGEQAIRDAFAQLSRRYHPDKFARFHSRDARELATEIFILIRDAYRALSSAAPGGPADLPKPGLSGRKSERASPNANASRRDGAAPGAIPSGQKSSPTTAGASAGGPTGPRAFRPAPEPATGAQAAPHDDAAAPAPAESSAGGHVRATALLDAGRYDEALTLFALASRRDPGDREAALGVEVAEGLKALAARDRLEAAQRFEAALELDPANERAARGLTEIRRQATEERKSFLSRLLGEKE